MDRRCEIPADFRVEEGSERDIQSAAKWPADEFVEINAMGLDGAGQHVAISDTGIAKNHPAFKNITIAQTKNYVSGGSNVEDGNGHGTHAGSLIFGIGYGAASKCTVKINQVLGSNGSGSTAGINQALVESALEGYPIVSASLGGRPGDEDDDDRRAIEKFYDNGGELYICAAGNAGFNGSNTIGPPGSYDWGRDSKYGVLTVGALRQDGSVANFSSGGKSIEVAAPGENIPGANFRGGEVDMSGTSMACPLVAGAVVLIKQRMKRIGLPRLKNYGEWMKFFLDNKLFSDIGTPGFDMRTGYGIIDLAKVIAWLKVPVGVMLFCLLFCGQTIAQTTVQDVTITAVPPGDDVVYMRAKDADIYPNSDGVIIVAKGLSQEQMRGLPIVVESGTPYLIFATDQSKVGFNPIQLTPLEKDVWLLIGEPGQKFLIVVIRTNADGNQVMTTKEVVIPGKPDDTCCENPDLKAWQDLAKTQALLVDDKPTANALGQSYIRVATTLTTIDLNEAYKRVELETGNTLANRRGVSEDKNWNVYLTFMADKLAKAKVSNTTQYSQLVNAWGKGLLEAAK